MSKPELSKDFAAALAARRELGERYEAELVAGFVERAERAIDERVEARLREHAREHGSQIPSGTALGIASLLLGIPLTGVGANYGGLAGVIVVWGGIAAVNVAQAVRARRT